MSLKLGSESKVIHMSSISQDIDEIIWMHKNYQPSFEEKINNKYSSLKEKINAETDPSMIIKALDRSFEELFVLDIPFMFEAYQKAIQLDPLNTKLIEEFIFYVDVHSGPDWEEEVEKVRMLLNKGEIEKAGKVALTIDYYKWD